MNRRSGQTLVASLIVIAIILVLTVVFLKGGFGGSNGATAMPARADNLGTTVPGRAKLEAYDTQCKSDLDQVRQAIQVAQASDSTPASLQDLKLPASMLKCPVGGEPYVYDPQTGQVHCPHPGHEKY